MNTSSRKSCLKSVQVFPSGHRGTGNGVAIGLNRIMGIVSAVVGEAADVSYHFPCRILSITLFAIDIDPHTRPQLLFPFSYVLHYISSWLLWLVHFPSSRTADEAANSIMHAEVHMRPGFFFSPLFAFALPLSQEQQSLPFSAACPWA